MNDTPIHSLNEKDTSTSMDISYPHKNLSDAQNNNTSASNRLGSTVNIKPIQTNSNTDATKDTKKKKKVISRCL